MKMWPVKIVEVFCYSFLAWNMSNIICSHFLSEDFLFPLDRSVQEKLSWSLQHLTFPYASIRTSVLDSVMRVTFLLLFLLLLLLDISAFNNSRYLLQRHPSQNVCIKEASNVLWPRISKRFLKCSLPDISSASGVRISAKSSERLIDSG